MKINECPRVSWIQYPYRTKPFGSSPRPQFLSDAGTNACARGISNSPDRRMRAGPVSLGFIRPWVVTLCGYMSWIDGEIPPQCPRLSCVCPKSDGLVLFEIRIVHCAVSSAALACIPYHLCDARKVRLNSAIAIRQPRFLMRPGQRQVTMKKQYSPPPLPNSIAMWKLPSRSARPKIELSLQLDLGRSR